MRFLIGLLLFFAPKSFITSLEFFGIFFNFAHRMGGWCNIIPISDKYAKLKFIIALSMFDEFGAGYELSITEISKTTSVLDPHEFEVVAKCCQSIAFEGDKPPVKSIVEMKFTIKADSLSVRSILKATKEGLKTATKELYEIT